MNLFALDEILMYYTAHMFACGTPCVVDGSLYYDKTKNGSKIKRWRLDDIDMEDVVYKAFTSTIPLYLDEEKMIQTTHGFTSLGFVVS